MIANSSQSAAKAGRRSTLQWSNAVLFLDGCFLAAMGLIFGASELLSHFWGIGFQGSRFTASPYTIGFFEAHFDGTRHKIAYGVSLFYIAASAPLHTWQAYLNNSTQYLRWFPLWWTILLLPIYTGIIVLTWRLRFKER